MQTSPSSGALSPSSRVSVRRLPIALKPDRARVLFRPFIAGTPERIRRVIDKVMDMSDSELEEATNDVFREFGDRHLEIDDLLLKNYQRILPHALGFETSSHSRQLLIGAYFTSEFALESAALFNPSIVPHPDQSDVPAGGLRFILSLRATGEGHVSSIEFREGIIDANLDIQMDPVSGYVNEPECIADTTYDNHVFQMKLQEMGFENDYSRRILSELGAHFTRGDLESTLSRVENSDQPRSREKTRTRETMKWLMDSNYEIRFSPSQPMADRIIFPSAQSHKNGLEDARFVLFTDDRGESCYYATYTAFDGAVILPQFLSTKDFLHFKINTLNGKAVTNKGLALFPRLIDGQYAMLSRQDDESIFIMFSDNLHFWHDAELLLAPQYHWEWLKIGNCGSPIETEYGWLVLTHGVGPMRRYCLGAALLDRDNPTRVIGRLPGPLLEPEANEREGYVPNVVYSCGACLHDGNLIVPYGMSDYATGFAAVALDELIGAMVLAE